MTLDQLLGKSAADLEMLSDADLERELSPFFDVTRPERIVGQTKKSVPTLGKTAMPLPLSEMRKLAEKHGLGGMFSDIFD